MFTVGYLDTYPHTVVGKVAATAYMMLRRNRPVRLGHGGVGLTLFVETWQPIVEAQAERAKLQAQISDMAQTTRNASNDSSTTRERQA